MKFESVIGLEIHAELHTKTKIFCGCSTAFGEPENTQTCPVCLGLPGALPVLNKKVVEYGVMAGMALNCNIATYSKMDRKNYFYPDLPKAYQISQYHYPLCTDGYVSIEVEGEKKNIGITRIHIEEDAGKLSHDISDGTLIDYNRCGVPLIEIVSQPDIRSGQEAKAFAEKIKAILEYMGVCDGKMQEGSLRFDVNVSLRPQGQQTLGTRTEIKNLNSFRSLLRAIEYEIKRQQAVLEAGNTIVQETRKWDENREISLSLRSKEESHDYRYIPEPDLMPIILEGEDIERIKRKLPELPHVRKNRYIETLGLSKYQADILTASKEMGDYFEGVLQFYNHPKKVCNWMMGEVSRLLKTKDIGEIAFQPKALAQLLAFIDDKTISGTIGKKVLEEMFKTGKDPGDIIIEKDLAQIRDEKELEKIIQSILKEHPQSVRDYKAGKEKTFGFIIGQIMKKTRGKASPEVANNVLKRLLKG